MAKRISDLLQKPYWRRRVNPDAPAPALPSLNRDSQYYVNPDPLLDTGFQLLTQEDFMREIEPAAHSINSKYQSTRPIYEAQPVLDADGNPALDEQGQPVTEWVVTGYDDLETVRMGLQKRICMSKSAFFGGGHLWVCHEDNNHESMETLSSWMDIIDMDAAKQEIINSCFHTGDAAIYLYQNGNTIDYEIFSYLKGDILFHDYDLDHNPIVTRLYTLRGKTAVDIYGCGYRETWIQDSLGEDKEKNGKFLGWIKKFGGWFQKGMDWNSAVSSEDGWTRLVRRDSQIGSNLNQCIYFRIDDIPSGAAQKEIEALERCASFVADGVKSQSQQKLFVKATNIDSLPSQGSWEQIIGVRGNEDELRAADAKILAPADISNIAELDLKTKKESIWKTTMSNEVTPDVMRQGADSSAAIKLLYSDEILWCKNEYRHFAKPLRYMVEVLKALTSKVEGDNGVIAKMRTSCGLDWYLPRNEKEDEDRILNAYYARLLSRDAARAELHSNHKEDGERIWKDWEKELELKARIPAEVQAQVALKYGQAIESENTVEEEHNPSSPSLDNRFPGKDIAKE